MIHCIGSMDDATQRLNQGRLGHIKSAANRNRVDRRHGDVFSQATRQSGDAMLSVKLALMRIAGAAVITERRAPQAHAVQALIDHHAIPGLQIPHLFADFFDAAADFVPEHLRLNVKGNRLAELIGMVISIAGEDMRVGAAQPDCRDAHQNLVR